MNDPASGAGLSVEHMQKFDVGPGSPVLELDPLASPELDSLALLLDVVLVVVSSGSVEEPSVPITLVDGIVGSPSVAALVDVSVSDAAPPSSPHATQHNKVIANRRMPQHSEE